MKSKPSFDELVPTIERSVNYLANRVSKRCKIEFDDAKQELLISAYKAYQSYDASKAKFTTYSVWRMTNAAKTLINERMNAQIDLNTVREADLGSDANGDMISIDSIAVDERPNPEEAVLRQLIDQAETTSAKQKLDELESLLYRLQNALPYAKNKHAYALFRILRYEEITRADGKAVPVTISEAARRVGIVVQRASTIFTTIIAKLGTPEGKTSIVDQIETAEASLQNKESNMAAKKEVEKKGKGKAVVAEKKAAGRTPKAGGLREKIDWLEKNFVQKGKTRSEAVAALQAKYPDMSINYARTVVYSSMKDSNWTPSERKAPAKKTAAKEAAPAKKEAKAPAKPEKKAPAKPAKKAAKVEEEFDDEDEDDFDLG